MLQEAAKDDADRMASERISQGDKYVVINLWREGGGIAVDGPAPMRRAFASLGGKGNSPDSALDQAMGPQMVEQGLTMYAQYIYESGKQGRLISSIDYDRSISRGRAEIDQLTEIRLSESRVREGKAIADASSAKDSGERERALQRAEAEKKLQQETKEEHDRRVEDRKRIDEIKSRIREGRATESDQKEYSDEFKRYLKESSIALCAQHGDGNCSPCAVCRAMDRGPEILVVEDKIFRVELAERVDAMRRVRKDVEISRRDKLIRRVRSGF